jgi:predicted RND superfamily exporter protein
MPSPTRQQEVLAFLAAERAGRLDFARIRGNFLRELETQGLRPDPFLEGIDLLGRAVNADRPIALSDLDSVEGARRLLARYLHVSDGLYKSVVYLYPEGDRWKSEPPPAADVLANRLGGEVQLTGVNVLSRSLRKQVWFDAIMAAILGTVLVIGLLWYDLREVRATLLSLAPLVIGTFWIAGAMVLLDLDINFMNIFVATMVIGIGIDYAVHMLHRYREVQAESDEVMVEKLAETARSVAMAALTTVVGFGSLALSHYPGLRSIGYAATLGAALTALIAFTLLPAYLVLVRRGAFDGVKRNKGQEGAASSAPTKA